MSEIRLSLCGDTTIYVNPSDSSGDCYCSGLEGRIGDLEENKQDKLSAGTGITISGDIISATVNDQDFYTKQMVNTLLDGKQNTLSPGTGITIDPNGVISASGVVAVDSVLSSGSVNPVQNKVINSALNAKQNVLTATDGLYVDQYDYIGITPPREVLDWSVNDTYITGTGYCGVYTYAHIAICFFNLQLKASIPTLTGILFGLPVPGTNVVPFALCNTNVSAKVRVNENGVLITDGISPSTAGWYNGSIVYPLTSVN